MDNVDLNVLRQVTTWLAQGHRVVLGTITRTWGSAPRPPGSSVALRDDGLVAGSVSGGCIEDDLVDKARAGALTTGLPQVVRYGIDTDTAQRFGLPCGGLIELVLEPVQPRTRLDALLAKLDAGERVRRVLTIATGEVDLQPGNTTDELTLSDTTLVTHHGPRWRLLLIGAGQLSRYVAEMARLLDFEVLICDPREEFVYGWEDQHGRFVPGMPDEAVLNIHTDERTAIVCLTHDPRLDDMALLTALNSTAFYIGALGSRVNTQKRRENLAALGLSAEAIARLHGPIGLHIGSHTPAEIALSLMAEIVAIKNGVAPMQKKPMAVVAE